MIKSGKQSGKTKMTEQQGFDAIVNACRQEFNDRGAQGNLERQVRGGQRNSVFVLDVNPFLLQKINATDAFMRIGTYGTPAPAQGSDIVHARGEVGQWWTKNLNALRDSLNQNFLSEKNRITLDFEG